GGALRRAGTRASKLVGPPPAERRAGRRGVARASQRGAGPRRSANRRRFRREVFAGIDEAVALESILLVVELAISAGSGKQLFVRSALDDLTGFEHENLIGALNRRQPVRDDERRAAATQRFEAVLNHRFAFAVETRR